MRNSDWLKLKLRLIFLICVQTQSLCNGANVLSDEIKICYNLEFQNNENRAFLFLGDTRYIYICFCAFVFCFFNKLFMSNFDL